MYDLDAMILILGIAFISGVVTIAAPCIWPILPIVLSANAAGGKRTPLGVTLGVCTSFAGLTLALSYILQLLPFDPDILRYVAAAIIIIFGALLVVPNWNAQFEGWVSSLMPKRRINAGSGFWRGVVTGLALGIIWTPCAGPIFATIASLSAARLVTGQVVLVTLSYVLGISGPLFLFSLAGRTVLQRIKKLNQYLERIQQGFGIIMIITAVAIITNYDKVVAIKLLDFFPSYTSALTALESTDSVREQLDQISKQPVTNDSAPTTNTSTSNLFNVNPVAGIDFTGGTHWLNSTALSLADLKGKVVLVDFWTYTCINCIRSLPHVVDWYNKYKDAGFVVIGVHTPEFAFEKDTSNVSAALQQYGITYPVVQDNDYAIWEAYSNHYWPAEYLIDATGQIRRVHFGEGHYDDTEQAIQALLVEAGQSADMPESNIPDTAPITQLTPETYLGSTRSVPDRFTLAGDWQVNAEYIQSGTGSTLTLPFYAGQVFLVLTPPTNDAIVTVDLDGKTITNDQAGSDVRAGKIIFSGSRLYSLVKLATAGNHTVTLHFSTPNTEAFAFTFGD